MTCCGVERPGGRVEEEEEEEEKEGGGEEHGEEQTGRWARRTSAKTEGGNTPLNNHRPTHRQTDGGVGGAEAS
ncbi:unnamed protein product [Pleuronectes platessa]|uniref:Uncharacterized protein n=1 Tax=Pleuronectes platessa TaxID=8262 RepID=A0A9N7U4Z5_PLEPL|nr:unnamed protein product [Pleuronectes platessa]